MLKLDIETIVEPFVSKKRNINLVVGVINGDLHSILSFTGFSEPSSSTPDGDTLFEIGSITKVFTSTLLSILVEDGQLELKDFIGNLITKYEHLPRNITLESLATHTSGLPRLPSNLMKSAQKDPENPYAAYTIENLDEYLRSYDGKNVKTLGTISYSNLGVGLLGHILAHHLEMSYEEAIVSRICNPLTLSNTRITLTDEQQARLAIGRSSKGQPVKNWDLPTFAAAGALRSTANDLLKFLAANLKPNQTPFEQAINNMHKIRCEQFPPVEGIPKLLSGVMKLFPNEPLVLTQHRGIALGWFITHLPSVQKDVYWHNGGTGGYRSFYGFVKDTCTGVVILSNHANGIFEMLNKYSVDTIGLKILEKINSNN
ncbi:MAG: beta-lactamase family protein [Symploca sp. SIO3C6]|uniref:Beta-lactamase family protein n=1 Tax=Symploca sp. SIO1C4 TaxID=2607765 RepID=A0A6B3N7H8_9CYAN|nr:beta-lactamase family protein [Symploca sp. SIO3C6]NER27550.1 beta-lactamase family protein [Symploca sp. SIO1C4]